MFKVLTTLHRALGAIYDENNVLSQIQTIATDGTLVFATLTQIISVTRRVDVHVAVIFPQLFDDDLNLESVVFRISQHFVNNKSTYTRRNFEHVHVDSIVKLRMQKPRSLSDFLTVGHYETKFEEGGFDTADVFRHFPATKQLKDITAAGTLVTAVFTRPTETYLDNTHVTIVIPQSVRLSDDLTEAYVAIAEYLKENCEMFPGIVKSDLVLVNAMIKIESGIQYGEPHILNQYTVRDMIAQE
jgi:hypothetical protein